jgi:hypothetical protein
MDPNRTLTRLCGCDATKRAYTSALIGELDLDAELFEVVAKAAYVRREVAQELLIRAYGHKGLKFHNLRDSVYSRFT